VSTLPLSSKSTDEDVLSSAEEVTPHLPSSSRSSFSGSQDPDEKMDHDVEEVCGYVLNHVFGVSIESLQAPYPALDAIDRCLDELRLIIEKTGPSWARLSDMQASVDTNLPFDPSGEGQHGTGSSANQGTKRSHDESNSQLPKDGDKTDKAKNRTHDGNGSDANDSEEDDQASVVEDAARGDKRQKVETHRLPCPYRLRNRLRFNVRDNLVEPRCCEKSFASISKVK